MSRLRRVLVLLLAPLAIGQVSAPATSALLPGPAGLRAASATEPAHPFRESRALDRRYLLSHLRWSPCESVPVRVVGGPVLADTARRAVASVRRASGLRLRIRSGPLPDGRGIRVRARAIGDSHTLGRTDLLSLGGALWRADIDVDVAKTGPHRLTAVLEHELGHAVGVRHSPRHLGDVMSPAIAGRLPLSGWDRAALAYAGQGRCAVQPR